MGVEICEYGCGEEANYRMTNGKWCCENFYTKCSAIKKRNSETNKLKQLGDKNAFFGKTHSEKTKEILRFKKTGKRNHTELWKRELAKKMTGEKNHFFGKTHNKKTKKLISRSKQLTISKIKNRYPFFSQIEDMRYNPDKPSEKEIQVHCKNHLCENSKEKGGWFTPTKTQFFERKRQLESKDGQGGCYFYCSQKCKNICPLFNLIGDPFKDTSTLYNQQEYQTFRQYVLERDNYTCQFCGEEAIIVHHERPQKLEPFFSLDPDFAWSCCEKCHYEKGHKDECSTGNLAKKNCQQIRLKGE